MMPLEALVPEDEAIALPHQNLQLVASGVDKRKHRAREWIRLDHIPRQDRQPVDLPSHVHRRTVQVDALDARIRAQHPLAPRLPPIPSSAPATRHTRSPTLARSPGGTPGRCALLAKPPARAAT